MKKCILIFTFIFIFININITKSYSLNKLTVLQDSSYKNYMNQQENYNNNSFIYFKNLIKKNVSRKLLLSLILLIIIGGLYIIFFLKKIIKEKIGKLKKEIDKRKQIEKNLLEEKNKIQSLFNALDDIFFQIDNNYRVVDVVTSDYNKLYKSKEEIIGKSFFQIFPKDKAQEFVRMIKEVLETNEKRRYNYYLEIGKEQKFFEAVIIPFQKDTVIADIRDVSQEKSNYDTLRLFSDIIQQNLSIIIITDINGNIEYANPKFFEVTGYSINEIIGYNVNVLKSGEHDKEFYKNLWETILSNKVWHDIFINRRKNGELYWENAYITPVTNEEGKIIHFFKVAEDITSLINAETKLLKEQIKFDTYLEAANVMIVGIGEDEKVKFINTKGAEILGYSKKEIIGKNWIENFVPKNKQAALKKYFHSLFKNKNTKMQNKNVVLCKSGEEKLIQWQNVLLKDPEDETYIVIGSGLDITQQEREKLIKDILRKILYYVLSVEDLNEFYRKIRKQLNKMFDAKNIFIILKDEKSNNLQLAFNIDEKDNMTTLPKKKTLSEYVLRKNKALYLTKKDILDLINSGEAELVGSLPEVWIGIPLKTKNGPIGILGLQSYNKKHSFSKDDVSYLEMISYTIAMAIKYKNDEDKIEKTLKEKNDLLREVHHRVKNNIQYILSLFRIGNRFQKDKKVIEFLQDNINRIKVMSFLQNLLYTQEDMNDIDIYSFFFKIVENLVITYRKKVHFSIDINNIYFDYNLSLPLGLIINELITNCLKHAFKNVDNAQINISLKKLLVGYELIIEDNGIGLPEDIDFDNLQTFGLFFVKLQVEQIMGKMKVERTNGTKFIINFKNIKLATFNRY